MINKDLVTYIENKGLKVDFDTNMVLEYFSDYDIDFRDPDFGTPKNPLEYMADCIGKRIQVDKSKLVGILSKLLANGIITKEKRLSAPFAKIYVYGFPVNIRKINNKSETMVA